MESSETAIHRLTRKYYVIVLRRVYLAPLHTCGRGGSWAKLSCYELDFHLGLGRPEAVRRPQFAPFESLIYPMPRALDGEVAVAVCVRDEDMERLRADEAFAMYGRYIG